MSHQQSDVMQYHFKHAVAGFVEIPTVSARQLLPETLQPIELRHGTSVLSVMVFDFSDTAVGPYGEVVLSVMVSPFIAPGRQMPRAAFYPVRVATSTAASRQHGIERWRLPHFPEDARFQQREAQDAIHVSVSLPEAGLLDLSVTGDNWTGVEHHYQSFMSDAAGTYMTEITLSGQFCENEDERGSVSLKDLAFEALGGKTEVTSLPFRELRMRDGVETMRPLETLFAATA